MQKQFSFHHATKLAEPHKQHLLFVGMQLHVTEALEGFGVLAHIRPGHRYADRLDALKHAAQAAGSTHLDDIPSSQDQ